MSKLRTRSACHEKLLKGRQLRLYQGVASPFVVTCHDIMLRSMISKHNFNFPHTLETHHIIFHCHTAVVFADDEVKESMKEREGKTEPVNRAVYENSYEQILSIFISFLEF